MKLGNHLFVANYANYNSLIPNILIVLLLSLLCTLERHSNTIIACPRQELLDWKYSRITLTYFTHKLNLVDLRKSDVKIFDKLL